MSGIGRVLVAVYGVLALAALGRSFVQIAIEVRRGAARLLALGARRRSSTSSRRSRSCAPGRGWYRVAWATIVFEFVGVIVVGTLSVLYARAVPARHGVVVVRPRLPVHPARAARARHVVARDAPSGVAAADGGGGAVVAPRGGCRVKTFKGLAGVPAGFGPSAVTIGKFDGVHQGHRAVIGRLRAIAEAERPRGGRGHVRPQPARAARARQVPRRARERAPEARAARDDRRRRHR